MAKSNGKAPPPGSVDPGPKKKKFSGKRKACRTCEHWNEVKERVRITELLQNTIEKMADKLTKDDFKPSLADYLKLMQIERELDQEQVKEITVTWVAPSQAHENEQ